MKNVDDDVVAGFGNEWARFDYGNADVEEMHELFEQYFSMERLAQGGCWLRPWV